MRGGCAGTPLGRSEQRELKSDSVASSRCEGHVAQNKMLARRLRPVGPTRAWARSLAAAAGKPPGKPNLPPLPFPMHGSRQQQRPPKPMELTGRVVIATDKTFTSLKLCSGCGVELAPKSEAAVAGQAFAEEDARGISLASRRKRGAYATYDESSGLLCSRCRALREGNVWEAYDAIADIDPAVFKKQLKALVARRQWSLCLKVVQSVSVARPAPREARAHEVVVVMAPWSRPSAGG